MEFYAVLHQFLMCKVWSIVLRMKIEVSHQSSKLILVSLQWVRIEFGASASSFGSVWQGTNLLVQQALRTHHKYNCKYRINPYYVYDSHIGCLIFTNMVRWKGCFSQRWQPLRFISRGLAKRSQRHPDIVHEFDRFWDQRCRKRRTSSAFSAFDVSWLDLWPFDFDADGI